jgi:hypothetical protein
MKAWCCMCHSANDALEFARTENKKVNHVTSQHSTKVLRKRRYLKKVYLRNVMLSIKKMCPLYCPIMLQNTDFLTGPSSRSLTLESLNWNTVGTLL